MTSARGKINMDKVQVLATMSEAKIPGISVASFDVNGASDAMVLGVDHKSKAPLTPDAIFRAASLSKPVFAYLVLKLIEDNKSRKALPGLGQFPKDAKFDLETPLHAVFPGFLDKFCQDLETQARAIKLTAKHVLSHSTGLPIKQQEGELLKFQFEPGTEYGYSNPGIALLQEAIGKLTGSNLQALAKANIFVPLGMTNTNFLPPEYLETGVSDQEKLSQMHAANSLHTTASEYARFIAGWMSNEALCKAAFSRQITMENDEWAEGQGLSLEDRKKIGWGLGVGLQLDSKGDATRAFHSGDMDNWRAFIAIDLQTKTGLVYFANSPNGLMLADKIITPNVELNDGLTYIFEKYGFARKMEPGWKEKEIDRVCKIIVRNELNYADLQDRKHLAVDDNKGLSTLSVKCEPNCSLINRVVNNEFNDFKEKHGLEENRHYRVEAEKDTQGNILHLKINIFDRKLYDQFVDKLNAEKFLPSQTSTLQDTQVSKSYKSPTLTRNRHE